MLVGPSKYLKKILNKKLNRVKNPNWPEAKQLAIYKCGRGFELEATIPNPTGGQSVGLELGPLNCKSSALTTWPHCLLQILCIFSKCPR